MLDGMSRVLFAFVTSVTAAAKRMAANIKVLPLSCSALKSGPVPVLGSSGLKPWTRPVLIFPNMEGPHKTGFTQSWAVLGPVLVKTDS